MVLETKLDESFPQSQFKISGISRPFISLKLVVSVDHLNLFVIATEVVLCYLLAMIFLLN